jgi:SAM-dependent MidA family methyltransferase
MGSPTDFSIMELGAGKGILSKNILDYLQRTQPALYDILQYHIVEISTDHLIPQQQTSLEGHQNVQWTPGSVLDSALPTIQGVILSNELVDAFPVERVMLLEGKPVQKFVTIENGNWVELWEDPTLEVQKYLEAYAVDLKEGSEIPVNLHIPRFIHQVDNALTAGAVLTIDYAQPDTRDNDNRLGARSQKDYKKQFGNRTVQERIAGMYEDIGHQDLTADVPFDVMGRVAEQAGGLHNGFETTQATLMKALGLKKIVQKDVVNELRRIGPDVIGNLHALAKLDRAVDKYNGIASKSVHNFKLQCLIKNIERNRLIEHFHSANFAPLNQNERLEQIIIPPVIILEGTREVKILYPKTGTKRQSIDDHSFVIGGFRGVLVYDADTQELVLRTSEDLNTVKVSPNVTLKAGWDADFTNSSDGYYDYKNLPEIE